MVVNEYEWLLDDNDGGGRYVCIGLMCSWLFSSYSCNACLTKWKCCCSPSGWSAIPTYLFISCAITPSVFSSWMNTIPLELSIAPLLGGFGFDHQKILAAKTLQEEWKGRWSRAPLQYRVSTERAHHSSAKLEFVALYVHPTLSARLLLE